MSRSFLAAVLACLPVLAAAPAHGETFVFSYRFEGNFIPENESWGAGAVLAGEVEGNVDLVNPDLVIVHSFGRVILSRPGLPLWVYEEIDGSEIASSPPGGIPMMSFSGSVLSFKACPGGFTDPLDCFFGTAPGGGFLMEISPRRVATAADGTGGEVCPDERRLQGCRVADIPFLEENWSLIRVDDDSDSHSDDDSDSGSDST